MKKVVFSVLAWDWDARKEEYDLTTILDTEHPDEAFECFKNTDVSADRTELRLEMDNGHEIIWLAFKCAACGEDAPYILMDSNNDPIDYDGIAKSLIAIPVK